MTRPIQRHVYVSGQVQGVFFRDFTRQKAESSGVAGWVRNLPDGRVEAILEGEPTGVERLLDAMRAGPPAARVDDIQVSEAPPGHHDRFEVR
ncbi:acylphosphatase [Guyparkeria sp.]|uniref:acylphosphatase n=1 Tax=Guyparkeria sp. TaxID=2035736 RepID=UPI003970DC85